MILLMKNVALWIFTLDYDLWKLNAGPQWIRKKFYNFEDIGSINTKGDTQKNFARMYNAEAKNCISHPELRHHTFTNEDQPYTYQI